MTDRIVGMPLGPSRAERAALRVVQVGAIAAVLVSSALDPFELDRFFVPKELVLHLTALVAGVLAIGGARRVTSTRVDLWLAAVLVLGIASTALAQNPWAAGRSLAISVSGLALFWVGRVLRAARLDRPLLNALALAVVLAVATALAQAYGLDIALFSENRAPGGSLGNRNFVAHLVSIGLPLLLLVALRAWRPGGVLIAAVGISLGTAALVMSRSRAAWLAVAAVLLVVLVGWLLTPPLRRHRRSWLRFAAVLPVMAAGVAAAVLLPNDLDWRSDSPYLETARGVVNYQEGSGRGRLIQYRNTIDVARSDPLLGVGPGNWAVAYPDHARAGDPSLDQSEQGMTSNPWPSSDWVALLAERGIPAFVLLLLAWTGLTVGAWRRMRAARDAEEGTMALALLAMLAGTAVVGFFDAVLLLAWPTLVFWTAAGALWSPEDARAARVPAAGKAVALGLLALLASAAAVRSGGQLGSMWLYANRDDGDSLELAARLDPGSYRAQLRLARYYGGGDRRQRCEHARAAHDLFPNAVAAREMARRCD